MLAEHLSIILILNIYQFLTEEKRCNQGFRKQEGLN